MAINEFYEDVSWEEYEEDFSEFIMNHILEIETDYLDIDSRHFMERTTSPDGCFCRLYTRYEEPVEIKCIDPITGDKYTSLNTRYTYTMEYWFPGSKTKVVSIE